MARYQLVEYGEDDDSGCFLGVVVPGLLLLTSAMMIGRRLRGRHR